MMERISKKFLYKDKYSDKLSIIMRQRLKNLSLNVRLVLALEMNLFIDFSFSL